MRVKVYPLGVKVGIAICAFIGAMMILPACSDEQNNSAKNPTGVTSATVVQQATTGTISAEDTTPPRGIGDDPALKYQNDRIQEKVNGNVPKQ